MSPPWGSIAVGNPSLVIPCSLTATTKFVCPGQWAIHPLSVVVRRLERYGFCSLSLSGVLVPTTAQEDPTMTAGSFTPNVQPAARSTLVTLVEEHVTSLIRQAACVTAHCKRARTHHVSNSDDVGGGEGTDCGGRVVRRRLHAEDINMALQWRGSEKLYATAVTSDSPTIVAGSSDDASEQNQPQSQQQHNKVVDLKEYLRSEMDFRPPQEVGLTVHWLAVNGQQPRIPQNPMERPRRGRAVAGLVNRYDENDDDDLESEAAAAEDVISPAAVAKKGSVQVNQLRAQLLSEELQLYFVRVTSALERGGATPTARRQQDAALASVGRDTGLQELVPFLVHYILNSYEAHIGNPEQSHTLVRLVQALLVNPHLHLELHVSQN